MSTADAHYNRREDFPLHLGKSSLYIGKTLLQGKKNIVSLHQKKKQQA